MKMPQSRGTSVVKRTPLAFTSLGWSRGEQGKKRSACKDSDRRAHRNAPSGLGRSAEGRGCDFSAAVLVACTSLPASACSR